jgi:3-oxoacyl-[acyl-carrier protein] reductase
MSAKLALVTGASRGIGRAILLELARQGYYVVGTATSASGADKISEVLKEHALQGEGKVLDVTSQCAIDELLAELESRIGMPAVLVNNAGITRDNLLMRMSSDEWDSIIQTNLSSIYRLSKACVRSMMKARFGRIISIGSVVGMMGNAGQANYCAAKAGVVGFSKALAREVASRGITVNVIPAKRIGEPEEIAAVVAFLASDKAGYINGETIHVNGGMYMV